MDYQSNSPRDSSNMKIVTGVVCAILVVLFLLMIRQFFEIVPPAHKGLVIKGGQLQEEVLENGFYLTKPLWTEIIPVYVGANTTDEGKNVEENFRGIRPLSKDGQIMEVDVQINYSVVDAVQFRKEVGSTNPVDIETLLFVPTMRRLVYDYVAEYTWKNLIQGGDRQELGQRIYKTMSTGEVTKRVCSKERTVIDPNTKAQVIEEAGCKTEKIENIASPLDYGVVITAINLRKVAPNKNIIAAVEEAQKKEQQVKVAEQEAEIAKQQAVKLVEQKRGETESRKLEQEAEAHKIRVEMEANADGIKAEASAKREQAVAERELASALSSSKGLIDYKRLDIEMVMAEAQLEFAKHYKGSVPQSVTILGDKASENNRLLFGMPNVSVLAGQENSQ